MPSVDPRILMRAAMNAAPAVGAPSDVTPASLPLGASTQPTGATPTAVSGLPSTAGLSNVDLASVLGTGSDLSNDPDTLQQMTQVLQDPATPPDQKAAIQARLQLAALRQLAGGPSGAVGTPSS
jgi:hypothetical protein